MNEILKFAVYGCCQKSIIYGIVFAVSFSMLLLVFVLGPFTFWLTGHTPADTYPALQERVALVSLPSVLYTLFFYIKDVKLGEK